MKKNPLTGFAFKKSERWKIFLIMRLTMILLVGFLFGASANSLGQYQMKVNMGETTYEELFREIRKQTGCIVMYNNDMLDKNAKVKADFDQIELKDLLHHVLTKRGLTFEINREFIIVVKATPKTDDVKKYRISGIVKDKKGEPMPGVTIKLDSMLLGTATDVNGKFVLELPVSSGNLVCSFVGYKTKKIPFKGNKDLVVILEEDISELDEVHVVAYGQTNKREMTGAISVVKAESIKGIPSPSIANLLQGRVAGMDVTNITGAPGGGGTQVTIRGYNSLSVESGRRFSNPLWVVDGVPMASFTSPVTGTNGLADLNPEVIESIQILKDASATSLYGSRAANGVIIVTTKKGRKNQSAQFDVNFSYTYNVLPEYPVQTGGKAERNFRLLQRFNARKAYKDQDKNMYIYPTSYEEAYAKGGSYDAYWGDGTVSGNKNGDELQDSLNPFYNNSTNFYKYYFQATKTLNANIQTSGGSERMTYSVGLGYYDEEGILKGTGYSRINLMGNFIMNPIPMLTVDFRNYLAFSDRSRGVKSSGFSAGNEVEVIPGDPLSQSTLLPGNNTVTEEVLKGLRGVEEKNNTYRLRSTFGLKLDLMKGLNISNTISLDYSQNNRNYFSPSWLNDPKESLTTGEVSREYTILDEALINYQQIFGERHKLDVMLGYSYQYDQYNYIGGTAQNGPSDYVHYATKYGWPSLADRDYYTQALKDYQSDFTEKKMMSYFGRLNYVFEERYMLTATLRRDGSSVFGRDLRWATFPSAAIAWNFSEENFMQWFGALSFGKLRFSYGVSGNQFNQPYLAYGLLLGGQGSYEGNPIITPDLQEGYYNPKLGWEETKQYDLGLDMNFFNYRLSVTADYYYRRTDKMLSKTPIPGNHSGYSAMWRNAGALSNEGIEFDIKYDIMRTDDSFWTISVNFAKNWNKLLETYNGKDMNMSDMIGNSRSYIIGKPVGNIMGYKTTGYIQSEEDIKYYYRQDGTYRAIEKQYFSDVFYKPGDLQIVDVNGDGYINSTSDVVYIGSSLPILYGGIVNEIKWKNFDLNMLWSYSLGRDMINLLPIVSTSKETSLYPIFEDIQKVSFWEKEGDNSTYPKAELNNFNDSWSPIIDRYVEKVNYLKLKTLTIGYTLPKNLLKKIYIKDVRVFFSGENLLNITNYSGLDPETVDINTGLDDGKNYPLARKLTLGITIKL